MKRKQESLLTKQRLLETAFQNFYEVGFENTSLDKISKDAHVSRGVLTGILRINQKFLVKSF